MYFSTDPPPCEEVGPIEIPNDSIRWYFIWASVDNNKAYFAVKSFNEEFFSEIKHTVDDTKTTLFIPHDFDIKWAGVFIGEDLAESFGFASGIAGI